MDLKKKYFELLDIADSSLILPVGKNKGEYSHMEQIYCIAFDALLHIGVKKDEIDDFYVIRNGEDTFSVEKKMIQSLKDGYSVLEEENSTIDKEDLTNSSIDYVERYIDKNEKSIDGDLKTSVNEYNAEKDFDDELENFSEELDDDEFDNSEEDNNESKLIDNDVKSKSDSALDLEVENIDPYKNDELEYIEEPDFSSDNNANFSNDVKLEFMDEITYEEPNLDFIDDDGIDSQEISNNYNSSYKNKDSYLEDEDDEDYFDNAGKIDNDQQIDGFNNEVGPIMPYTMHASDFTFSIAAISIDDLGQRTDVKLIISPIRVDIDTPDILVDVITKSGSRVYLSDHDKKVVANVDGYDLIITGYMDDDGIFNTNIYVEGVSEDSVKIRKTYNDGGKKGHTMAYDSDNNVIIHVIPIGTENNNRMFANFIYYIDNNGEESYGDTSNSQSGINFKVDGEDHLLKATWDKDKNFILSIA